MAHSARGERPLQVYCKDQFLDLFVLISASIFFLFNGLS